MKQLLVLLVLFSTALSSPVRGQETVLPTPSTAAAQNPAPAQAEKEKDWQEHVDDWFGKALTEVGHYPFYNVLRWPWLAPEGPKNDDGDPIVTDADGVPVISPQRAPVIRSVPAVVLWLIIAAVLFTVRFRFVNIRMFKHAIACVAGRFSDPNDQGEVTHFQALSSALSATVGLGNIAGVAIAISIGGPGATFWMILAGLLGMTLKFTECTLGQLFRTIDDDGRVSGGPMHYLYTGLKEKSVLLMPLGAVLSVVFMIFCIGGSMAGGNAFQVNQSLGILKSQVPFFKDHSWVYGAIMAFFVAIVIIGGFRRIATTASKIVPLMCTIYVVSATCIIIAHIASVPSAFGSILNGAFNADAMYGGAIGALCTGFQRAAFSNEAGVGSASIAHSAAKTPYAVREGIVALLEPFIDTVVVCTMTALVIVITGVYDPAGPHAELVATKEGAALTLAGVRVGGLPRRLVPVGLDDRGRAVRVLDHDLVVVLRRTLLDAHVRHALVHRLQDPLPRLRRARLDHDGQERSRVRRPDDPADGVPQHHRPLLPPGPRRPRPLRLRGQARRRRDPRAQVIGFNGRQSA